MSFPLMASGYQLGPFEVGQIKAHIHHGLSAAAIARIVCKADGTHVSDKGVLSVMARLEADPDWRGERKVGSGRKRKTPRALDKRVAKEVVKRRGVEKITVRALQKKLPELRTTLWRKKFGF